MVGAAGPRAPPRARAGSSDPPCLPLSHTARERRRDSGPGGNRGRGKRGQEYGQTGRGGRRLLCGAAGDARDGGRPAGPRGAPSIALTCSPGPPWVRPSGLRPSDSTRQLRGRQDSRLMSRGAGRGGSAAPPTHLPRPLLGPAPRSAPPALQGRMGWGRRTWSQPMAGRAAYEDANGSRSRRGRGRARGGAWRLGGFLRNRERGRMLGAPVGGGPGRRKGRKEAESKTERPGEREGDRESKRKINRPVRFWTGPFLPLLLSLLSWVIRI